MSIVVHCKRDPYDVYIGCGRDPRTGELGSWGNPFSHRPSNVPGVTVVSTREEAIARYADWLAAALDAERLSLEELAALHGKALGCWCAPQSCHGEVLVHASAWAARMLSGPANVFWELRPRKRGGYFA
jgi:hypothetical protein